MSSLHARPFVRRTRRKKSYCNFFLLLALMRRTTLVSANCGNMQLLETGGISCNLIKDIVNTHNELRQAVAEGRIKNQPIATNMREFYWDEELANGAQNWANQCTFAHNDEKDREVARFRVGQSLAVSRSKRERATTKKDFRKQITKWFSEHKDFKFGPILTTEDLQIVGHYTQVVWASTYLVGCGYSRYKSSSNLTHRLYVCHYGPTGNEFGKEPYEPGSQKCPENLIVSKKYAKLCSLKKSPANPCRVESKRSDTRTNDDATIDTRGKNFRDGRRSFSVSPEKIESPDDSEKSKAQRFDEKRNDKNIIFNIFLNI